MDKQESTIHRRYAASMTPDAVIDLTSDQNINKFGNLGSYQCPICLASNLQNPVATKCGHIFCGQCLTQALSNPIQACPVCKNYIDRWDLRRLYF